MYNLWIFIHTCIHHGLDASNKFLKRMSQAYEWGVWVRHPEPSYTLSICMHACIGLSYYWFNTRKAYEGGVHEHHFQWPICVYVCIQFIITNMNIKCAHMDLHVHVQICACPYTYIHYIQTYTNSRSSCACRYAFDRVHSLGIHHVHMHTYT